jgi:MFS family permease
VSTAALALSTSVWVAAVVCVPFGAGSAAFVSSSNVILQTRTDPSFRGRVLALGAVAFLGSTPVGGPITGIIGDTAGAVWATLYGAVVAGVCLLVGVAVAGRTGSADAPVAGDRVGGRGESAR